MAKVLCKMLISELGKYCHSHFTGGETDAERLSGLLKVLEEVGGRAESVVQER